MGELGDASTSQLYTMYKFVFIMIELRLNQNKAMYLNTNLKSGIHMMEHQQSYKTSALSVMSDVTARCLISLIWTGEAKGLQTSESDHQTDPRLSQTAQTLQTTQTTHVNLHAIYLKRNLECMVINVLIYIVRTKDVKRFHMLNVTRDIVMAIDQPYV